MNEHTAHAATHLTAHFPDLNQHLSDEQFADAMLGIFDSSVDLHLSHCDACRAEVLQWADAVATLAETGRAWSERQPVPAEAKNIRKRALMYSMRPAIGFAAAAIAVICIAIPVGRNQREAERVAMTDHSSVPLPAPAVRMVMNVLPIKARVEKIHARVAKTIAATHLAPVTVASDTLEQDNALMAAIGAEIASPMSGSIESAARTATISQ